MGVTELILLIFGGVVFTVSFLIPSGGRESSDRTYESSEKQIQEIIDREITEAKAQINDIVEETVHYSMEKTERSMERLTNEKMMAVNEYSDTVLEQINKNHKEAVFLYDMLNDKHESLKTTVSEAAKTAEKVQQTVKDAEITARETKARVEEFVPIQPERVEITEEDGVVAVKQETPKKRTGRKQTSSATAQEPVKTKSASRAGKAAKVDVNMAADGKTNSNERILELHRAGKSNMAIAKELSLGIGEVKLVIDLFEGI